VVHLLKKAGYDAKTEEMLSFLEVFSVPAPMRNIQPELSPVQLDVLAVLRTIYSREEVKSEWMVIPELGMKSDIFIPKLNLVVEVDGTDHFCIGNRIRARTLMRDGLILESSYSLAIVTTDDLNKLKGVTAKIQFMTALINSKVKPKA